MARKSAATEADAAISKIGSVVSYSASDPSSHRDQEV
jgi:hypothetical protein